MKRLLVRLGLFSVFLIALPPVGVFFSGQPLDLYYGYPPLTRLGDPAPFSPAVYALALLPLLVFLLFVGWLLLRARVKDTSRETGRGFPGWGWSGLLLTALGLVAGWHPDTGLDAWRWAAPMLQWAGVLLLINALTRMRSGHCLLTDQPGYLGILALGGLLLGWLLETLNRFTQSGYFEDLAAFSLLQYLLMISTGSALLLPVVMSLRLWLASFPRLLAATGQGPESSLRGDPAMGWTLLALSTLGLIYVAVWPDQLFILALLAPFMILTGFQLVLRERTLFAGLARGDWTRVILPALAGLLYGLLSAVFNTAGEPRWHYTLPWLQGGELLGVPVPAYTGFLLLGLVCMQLAELLAKPLHGRPRYGSGSPYRKLDIPIKVE